VCLDKSVDSIVAFVATLLAGKCYCPVDTRSPDARMARLLDNLDPVAVVTSEGSRARFEQLGQGGHIIVPAADQDAGLDRFEALVNECLQRNIDTDPAYIIYTSGSTGAPKGVTIAHRSIIDYIDWAVDAFAVTNADRIGNQAPFHFDNSTLDIYLCFATGATLLIIPEAHFTYPAKLIQLLAEQRVTFLFWVPSVIVNVANLDLLAHEPLPALRAVLFAGEAMAAKQLGYWMTRLPGRLFANLYGPTEITVDCTFCIVGPEDIADGQVPIGKACRNTAVLILTDADRPAAEMEQGELCVRGSSLALGYWRDDGKTAQFFVQNPLHSDYRDLIYRTGDLVYRRADGNIIFVGRKDNQIKHLGYRIELGEIEAAAEPLAGVGRCAAIYDKVKQEIILFVEPAGTCEEASLRAQLATALPKYMVPRRLHMMRQLPLNANGKIDRLALSSRADEKDM
jgi:amino acid adenylation domain-containing protein